MFEDCLYFNISKLARAINTLWEESFRPIGLSPSHAYMLLCILEQPGDTPKSLAAKMDLKISTVTRFIDSLVVKGLVLRRKENEDKRERSIYPTKSGENLKSEIKQIANKLHKKVRKILGASNVSETISTLKVFNAAINDESGGK